MYIMQIKIPVKDCVFPQWVSVRPSNDSKPYLFETELEAYKMLNLCYGGSDCPKRVGGWYGNKESNK